MAGPEGLLYRWGFLVETEPGAGPAPEGWRRDSVAGLTVTRHPDATLRRVDAAGGTALVLGTCYGIAGASVDAALARLLAEPFDPVALDDLSGRFCLVLARGGTAWAAADPFGAQTLFHAPGRPGVLASHSELLADRIGAGRDPDVAALCASDLYRTLSVKYLPGRMTSFEGVRALIPNHRLEIATGRTARLWPRGPLAPAGFEAVAERFAASTGALAGALEGRRVHIGVTGGIDTRVLMAGLTRAGTPMHGMTWLGPYHDPDEQPIIAELVARLGIRNVEVDIPGPRDAVATICARNTGRHRGGSRLTSAIAAALGPGPEDVFLRGWGGEIMRGFYNLLSAPMTSLDPEEQMRMYLRKSSRAGDAPDDVLAIVRAACADFHDAAGYDGLCARTGLDPNDLFYWEQRMGMWAAGMLTEMDPAMYGLVGLNDRRLFELSLGLPRKERLTKTLLERLIARLDPRLAGMPTA